MSAPRTRTPAQSSATFKWDDTSKKWVGWDGTASEPLAVRLNDGATYLYVGKAKTGSSTASAVWQIQRITQADTTIVWADGDALFDNVWNNYASLSYS